MTRSLLLTIALGLSCFGAATMAYLAGRDSGPDLTFVARAGTSSGLRSGVRAGLAAGHSAGFQAGYRAGFTLGYEPAYRAAYLRAAGG